MSRIDQPTMLKRWKEIFVGTYTVKMKTLFTYTEEQLELIGIPTTGDDYWDNVSSEAIIEVQKSIAELAEYNNKSIGFEFINRKSLEKIYYHIEDYVEGIVEMFNRNYVTEKQIADNPMYQNLINDIQILANFGNSLRTSISYNRSIKLKEEKTEVKQSLSLLSKMIHKDIEDSKPSTLPDEINIRKNMDGRMLQGASVNARRLTKPWRVRQGE